MDRKHWNGKSEEIQLLENLTSLKAKIDQCERFLMLQPNIPRLQAQSMMDDARNLVVTIEKQIGFFTGGATSSKEGVATPYFHPAAIAETLAQSRNSQPYFQNQLHRSQMTGKKSRKARNLSHQFAEELDTRFGPPLL